MLNQVQMIGHLTRDPELRYLASGTAVAKLSVALNSKWKGQDGQAKEEVSYIDVTVFGRSAENASEYLAKGRRVCITGRLKQDRWQDDQGNNRQKVGVIAAAVIYLDSKGSGGDQGGGHSQRQQPTQDAGEQYEEDIPF